MKESGPDPDQYQAELNDAVDDGSGCVKTLKNSRKHVTHSHPVDGLFSKESVR